MICFPPGRQIMTQLLTRKQVEERTALKRSKIYNLLSTGEFPQPVRIGTGIKPAVRWSAAEIDDWIAAKLDARPAKDK